MQWWWILHILRVAVLVLDSILSTSWLIIPVANAQETGEGEGEQDDTAFGEDLCGGCCEQLATEARLTCYELDILVSVGTMNCLDWQRRALEECRENCGDCELTWDNALASTCSQLLGEDSSPTDVVQRCEETKQLFVHARCAALCDFDFNICAEPEFKQCAHCGNYHACDCYSAYGNRQRSTCRGDVLVGRVQKKAASCSKMPRECMAHELDTQCGRYRYCPHDMCALKEVVCVPETSCQRTSTCLSETGRCRPILHPEGTKCETGLFYSRDGTGTCQLGTCKGEDDQCCKHQAKCENNNPCVKKTCDRREQDCDCTSCTVPGDPNYECDPLCDTETGLCLFVVVENGEKCDTHSGWIINEYCLDGICVGEETDLCAEKGPDLCGNPPNCRDTGFCDRRTGKCSFPDVIEDGTPCELPDASNGKGVCAEGFCRGQFYEEPLDYVFLGDGQCVDDEGRMPNRYTRTDTKLAGCQEQCTLDVTCEAYSVRYFTRTCELYTRLREGVGTGGWQLDKSAHESSGELTSVALGRPGEPTARCYKKVSCCVPPPAPLEGAAAFWLMFGIVIFFLFLSLIWGHYSSIKAGLKFYRGLDKKIRDMHREARARKAWEREKRNDNNDDVVEAIEDLAEMEDEVPQNAGTQLSIGISPWNSEEKSSSPVVSAADLKNID